MQGIRLEVREADRRLKQGTNVTATIPDLPFDLVILDLDGTILDLYHAVEISESVRAAIAAVQGAGIPVTIGTGRTLANMRTYIGGLGITQPVITTQGALIGDPVTGEVLAESAIPLDMARRVAEWVDAHRFITAFYFTDDTGHTRVSQNRAGPDPDFYDHVLGSPRAIQPSFGELLAGDNAHPPIKFIVVDDVEARPTPDTDIVAELQTLFARQLTVTRTHPQLVEGTAQGIDKGRGVRQLCQILDIDPQRVLAIGDNDNDIPMLQTVGYAAAMGNATDGVKAVADWIAPSIEEDGAAVALQKLVLDRLV